MNLTEKQLNIIKSDSYPQYVRAGAGTGKTEVLINKILHILDKDKDTSLKEICIVTFTNKAAEELKDRLAKAIYLKWETCDEVDESYLREQAEIVNMIEIGTIHSFCESLLREFGVHIGLPLNFKIKSFRKETMKILDSVVVKGYNENIHKDIPQYKMIKMLDILLTNNSNHGIILSPEDIESCLENCSKDEFWTEFKKSYLDMYLSAYQQIESEKDKQNLLTPNDLIAKAVLLLRNEYVAMKVAERFKYVFIDEFQDTNKDQFNMVNLLIQNGVKVFLVGDDKQSIYAFRGADVENSIEMQSIIHSMQKKNSEDVYLNENFRSDKSVIETINKIFGYNYYFGNELVKFPYEPLVVPESTSVVSSESDYFEIRFSEQIEKVINELTYNQKFNYGDITILCRRNFDLDRLSSSLKEKGYPVEVVGGKGFYRAKEIIDTYKLLNALINHGEEYQNELIFTDYYKSSNSARSITETFDELIAEFRSVLRKETVEEALSYIFDKTMILEYYRTKKQYQAIANLNKLKDISRELINKDNMQPIQFLEYLNIMITSGQDEDEAEVSEIERQNGVISVYSIHKAKGLSFPVVIVPYLETNLIRPITKPKIILNTTKNRCSIAFNSNEVSETLKPDSEYIKLLERKTIEQLEEELRIFYVACTRAKHKLVLMSDKNKSELKSNSYWKDDVSIAKWLMQIDNGEFVEKYTKQP